MPKLALLRVGLGLGALILLIFEYNKSLNQRRSMGISRAILAGAAAGNIFLVMFLFMNHINFPLHLEITEGAIWQHFQRAVEFKAIYPVPSPTFIPLAYNPLYYYLAVPFSWIFGVKLFTLRLLSIIGTLGSGVMIFLILIKKTKSAWWALISVGFFAASYRVMDNYFDVAHPDTWLLFSALLGTYIIEKNSSRGWNLIGLVLLAASFWFKQHGALFLMGGLAFLTWREGLRKSYIYWLIALILGPVFYITIGPRLFGPYFHFFTWEVPHQWSEVNMLTFQRIITYVLKNYLVLAVSTAWILFLSMKNHFKRPEIWHIQFFFAAILAFLGTLDPEASYNNYIPMCTLLIVLGTSGLYLFKQKYKIANRYQVHHFALFVIFATLLYNPLRIITSPNAKKVYTDLIEELKKRDAVIYAPSIGQLQSDYAFYPPVHWAALEDMIRGPGRNTLNHPNTRYILDSVLHPNGPAYILANFRLQTYPWIAFLEENYKLEVDFGDRFKKLRILPVRWNHGWPRYLYRFKKPNEKQGEP